MTLMALRFLIIRVSGVKRGYRCILKLKLCKRSFYSCMKTAEILAPIGPIYAKACRYEVQTPDVMWNTQHALATDPSNTHLTKIQYTLLV